MRRLPTAWVLLLFLAATGALHAETYNTPAINGSITISETDWDADDQVAADPPQDCRYDSDTDIVDLYATWDADNLYIGFTVDGGPGGYGNGLVVYVDTDAQAGITGATDFDGAQFYPRRITFSTMGVDVIIGGWDGGASVLFDARHCEDIMDMTPVEGFFAQWNPYTRHAEFRIPWEGIYGGDPGAVLPGTILRIIAASVGNDTSGAYDAAPSTSTGIEVNPATAWDAPTDLDVFVELVVDADENGISDEGFHLLGSISGTVTFDDPEDLTTRATLTAYQGETAVGSARTAAGGGAYMIPLIPAGTYDVRSEAASYLPDEIEGITVEGTEAVTGIDFSLIKVTGRIEGEVALVGDAPAVDVTVTIYDRLTGDEAGESAFVVAGGTGPFSIGTVLDGSYTVEATGLGYVEASVDTVVADGDTVGVGLLELSAVVATKYSFVDEDGNTIYGTATTVSLPDTGIYYYAPAWVQPRDDGDRVAYWDDAVQDSVLLSVTRLDPGFEPLGDFIVADVDTMPLTDSMITAAMFEDGRAGFLVADDEIEILRVLASRNGLEGVLEVGIGAARPTRLALTTDLETIDVGMGVAHLAGQLLDASGNATAVQGVNVSMSAGGVGGTFSLGSPETDPNGHFEIDFSGTVAGEATVTAIIDPASQYVSIDVDTLTIVLQPGEASIVGLSASPGAVIAGGICEITARVVDDWGNPVGLEGLAITLVANPSELVVSLDSPIVTGEDGVATGSLEAGTDYGLVEIAGSAGGLLVEAIFLPIDATIIATDEQAPESDDDHNSDPNVDLTVMYAANTADTLIVTFDFFSSWDAVHLGLAIETQGDAGGATSEPFNFPIVYGHDLLPDYAFTYVYSTRYWDTAPYADLRKWSGTAWEFYDFDNGVYLPLEGWQEGVRADEFVTKTGTQVSLRLPVAVLETAVGDTVRLQGYVMQEPERDVKYNALDSVPHDATHDMVPDAGDWWETATESVTLSNYVSYVIAEQGFPPILSDGEADPEVAQPGDLVTYTVRVEDGGGGVGDVFVDLSDIGGPALIRMRDDGLDSDQSPGDDVYTAAHTLTSAASDGAHTVTVTAKDGDNISKATLGIGITAHNPATAIREFEDPVGDDHGPNQRDSQDNPTPGLYYYYPTNFVFLPGSFDITNLAISADGEWLVFRMHVEDLANHQDPGAADWGAPEPNEQYCANPFRTDMNLQKIDIYIDAREGAGATSGFPSRNVDVARVDAWDYGISVEGWGKYFVISNDDNSQASWDVSEDAADIRVCNNHEENWIEIRVLRELFGTDGDDDEDIQAWDIIACLSSHDGDSNRENLGGIRWVNANTAEWQFGGGRDEEGGRNRDPNIVDIAASPGAGHEPGRPQEEMLDYTTPDAVSRFGANRIACVIEASFAEDLSPPIITTPTSPVAHDAGLQHIPWPALDNAPAVVWTTIWDLSEVEVARFHWQTLPSPVERSVDMVNLDGDIWAADIGRDALTEATGIIDLELTGEGRLIIGNIYARDRSANENEIWAGPFEMMIPEPWQSTQTFTRVDSILADGVEHQLVFQDGSIVSLDEGALPAERSGVDLTLSTVDDVDLENIRGDMEFIEVARELRLETDAGSTTELDASASVLLHYPVGASGSLDKNDIGLFRWIDETERWILVGGNSRPRSRVVQADASELGLLGLFFWEGLDVGDSDGLSGVRVEPNPFSPNGDGLYDKTRVTFFLGREADHVNIEFYDLSGRLARRLVFQEPASDTGRTRAEIDWDGTDAEGRVVPYGIYVMRMEAKFKTSPTYERVNRPVVVIK
jgi:hypothetical protein